MKNLKRGLAIALAAATAFTFAPVSAVSGITQAEAAEYNITNITVSGGTSTTMQADKYQIYTATADTAGSYVLTADTDAWQALNVTYKIDNINTPSNANQTAAINQAYSGTVINLNNGDRFIPTFSDARKGLNGTYTFVLKYTQNGQTKDVVSYKVTLEGSGVSGVTAAALQSIKNGANTISLTTDQMGNNSSYSLENGNNYDVTFKAPSYISNGSEILSGYNTELDVSINGNSVAYSDVKSTSGTNGIPNILTLRAAQTGVSTVTATWKVKSYISSELSTGTVLSAVKFTVSVNEKEKETTVSYISGGNEVTAHKNSDKTANQAIKLDLVNNKTSKIAVKNFNVNPAFVSDNPSVATVGTDGTVTAINKGYTKITVYLGNDQYVIPVEVSDTAADTLTVKADGEIVDDSSNPVNLDVATSTVADAIKSIKLDITSKDGLGISVSLYSGRNASAPVTGNSNNIAAVAQDGTITAGAQAGEVYIKVSSATDTAKKITGDTKWIRVIVNSKAPFAVTANTDEIKLDLKSRKSINLNKVFSVSPAATPVYSITASEDAENANIAEINGTTLTAKKIGEATVVARVPASVSNRETKKKVKLSVIPEVTRENGYITMNKDVLSLKPGDTDTLTATAATGASVTYASTNLGVATVDETTGVVKALHAGTATILVNATGTDMVMPASTKVTVIVEKPEQAKPVKVAGVKFGSRKKNTKKIRVSWNKQNTDGVYYQVEKVTTWKSGKKTKKSTAIKTVRNAVKTTLKITKNGTIKVRVRALVKSNDGDSVIVGRWSKMVTSRPKK